jgi:hypothetical protein
MSSISIERKSEPNTFGDLSLPKNSINQTIDWVERMLMNPRQKIDSYLVEEWVKLYNAGYSTRQIARYFHRGQRTVWRHLNRVMKLRPSLRDGPKYPKRSFSGDLIEKAYILGLRYTDLSTQRHRKQIQVRLSTTHPAMLDLFTGLFGKYTTVKCYPINKGGKQGYEWTTYCYVDSSFEFLEATKRPPSWILKDDAIFLSFFAGCVDGDGCISIEQRRRELWYPVIHLHSQNKLMLHCIFQKLKEMGYNPTINVAQNKGSVTYRKYRLNNNLWTLHLRKRSETIHLLKYLPLKHAEKVEKQKIILENADGTWTKAGDKVYRLRENIRKDVSECIAKAQREHDRKILFDSKTDHSTLQW